MLRWIHEAIMGNIWISALTGLLSGLVSAALTYFGTRAKARLDMTIEDDKHLRDKRLEVYQELWPMTRPFARFGVSSILTSSVLLKTSEDMSNWYFSGGGIFMSKTSRDPYFALREEMQRAIDTIDAKAQPDHPIGHEHRKAIVEAAGRLRTSLADDLRTRVGPWLG